MTTRKEILDEAAKVAEGFIKALKQEDDVAAHNGSYAGQVIAGEKISLCVQIANSIRALGE